MSLTPREQAEVEAALGLNVEPVAPSPQLKDAVMARIAVTPQLAPEGEPAAEQVVEGATEASVAAIAPHGKASRTAQARWFSRPIGVLVAAAAAAVIFVGGTLVGVGFSGNRTVDLEAQSLAALTSAVDLQRASAPIAGGGEATLIWSLDQRKSAILVNNLPALSSGKTYQLWYIGHDGPIPAGTFEASSSSTTWRVLDGAMSAGDTVGVTVEPAGGSPAPTTDPIVAIASS